LLYEGDYKVEHDYPILERGLNEPKMLTDEQAEMLWKTSLPKHHPQFLDKEHLVSMNLVL
jgi:capsule polysaccharide modification protein KpsS